MSGKSIKTLVDEYDRHVVQTPTGAADFLRSARMEWSTELAEQIEKLLDEEESWHPHSQALRRLRPKLRALVLGEEPKPSWTGQSLSSHWFQSLTRKQQDAILSAAVGVVRWTGRMDEHTGALAAGEEVDKLRAAFLAAGADIEEYT